MSEHRYTVLLTWDEMDEAMSALRGRIASYEEEAKTAPAETVAEYDQAIAGWWGIVHRMGDARRVMHGLDVLLEEAEPDWANLVPSDVVGD